VTEFCVGFSKLHIWIIYEQCLKWAQKEGQRDNAGATTDWGGILPLLHRGGERGGTPGRWRVI